MPTSAQRRRRKQAQKKQKKLQQKRVAAAEKIDPPPTILMLNDDCLEMIFSFCKVWKLPTLEKVCVRFSVIVQHFYKKLTDMKLEGGCADDDTSDEPVDEELQDLAQKVGPFVQNLKIIDGEFLFNMEQLQAFLLHFTTLKVFKVENTVLDFKEDNKSGSPQYKKTLEHFRIFNGIVGNNTMYHLVKSLPNLKILDIRRCGEIGKNLIVKLIHVFNKRPHGVKIYVYGTRITKSVVDDLAILDVNRKITLKWESFDPSIDGDRNYDEDDEDEYEGIDECLVGDCDCVQCRNCNCSMCGENRIDNSDSSDSDWITQSDSDSDSDDFTGLTTNDLQRLLYAITFASVNNAMDFDSDSD